MKFWGQSSEQFKALDPYSGVSWWQSQAYLPQP